MKNRKIAWWQPFLAAPIGFGLMILEHLHPLPGISNSLVDAVIVILIFAAMLAWVQINSGLLEWYYVQRDESGYDLKITVYEPEAENKSQEEADEEAAPANNHRPPLRMRRASIIRSKEQDRWYPN